MGMESFGGPQPSKILESWKEEIKESQEKRNEAISGAKNFDELYGILHQFKDLHGSKKNYSAAELVDIIEEVRKGEKDSTFITRAGGLRAKVEELLGANSQDKDSFEQFHNDSVASEILEKVSLEYLRTQDRDFLNSQYTGELDPDGFLIRKDGGKPLEKPSMNIGGGKAMQWVIERVKAELGR